MKHKLYIITNAELPSGVQTAQAAHAVARFAKEHPQEFAQWMGTNETIVVLQARNARKLAKKMRELLEYGSQVTAFHEPDHGYEMTAFAVTPGPVATCLLHKLPLAGT